MPMLGKDWMTIDGHSTPGEGGLLIEVGGPHEPLSEEELKAALSAVEDLRARNRKSQKQPSESEPSAGNALIITSDGRRIDLDTSKESYLLQAMECYGKSGWMVDAFDALIYGLLMERKLGRTTREDVMGEVEEFESQWQSLIESIEQVTNKYPALVEQSLANAVTEN